MCQIKSPDGRGPAGLEGARLELAAEVGVLVVLEEQHADHDRHERHDDRIPQAEVDVARCRNHRGRKQRQHPAEPAVTDVVWQRHRRVTDLGREELHEERRDRPVHHGHVDHHDEQDQRRHRPVDRVLVRRGRVLEIGERLLHVRLVPSLHFRRPDLHDHVVGGARGQVRRGERQSRLGQEVLRPVAIAELGPRPDEDVEVAIRRLHRDHVRLRERLQRRVHVVREPLEEREVRERRDEAAGQDDLQPPDLVRQRAENDEERRAQQQGEPDHRVRRKPVDLEGDREEEERVELARVPHHALARGGAQERQQHVLVVRIVQEALGERRLGPAALGLHPLEYRRLVQLQPDVDREDQQDERHQERNAPAPVGEILGAHHAAEAADADHRERQEESQRGRGLDP